MEIERFRASRARSRALSRAPRAKRYEALGPVIKAAAVKDLAGNAVKLRRNGAERAATRDAPAPPSLQAMIAADLAVQNHTHPDSSAMALLWLKRILEVRARAPLVALIPLGTARARARALSHARASAR